MKTPDSLQVRSAEARYEGLFENNTNPILITDSQGTIVDANRNACTLFGQAKEILCGATLIDLHLADGSKDFISRLEHMSNEREASFQTTIRIGEQGTTVAITGKTLQVKDSPLIQWIGQDISAELELEQTREDMVRMIIHDLRNPLANIMNSLDVLHNVITENDTYVPLDELITIARRSEQRMHQLISSILDIGRLETGQAILHRQPTDLAPLLRNAIQFIRLQTDIREIQLTSHFDPSLPWSKSTET